MPGVLGWCDPLSPEATKTSSQQELHRLLLWMRDNPEDWDRICHPETYETDMDYIVTMVDTGTSVLPRIDTGADCYATTGFGLANQPQHICPDTFRMPISIWE